MQQAARYVNFKQTQKAVDVLNLKQKERKVIYDQEIEIGRIPFVFTKKVREDRDPKKSGDIQDAGSRKET